MPNVLISIKYYYQIKAFFRKRYERVYNLEIELLLHDVNIMVAFGGFGKVGFLRFLYFHNELLEIILYNKMLLHMNIVH